AAKIEREVEKLVAVSIESADEDRYRLTGSFQHADVAAEITILRDLLETEHGGGVCVVESFADESGERKRGDELPEGRVGSRADVIGAARCNTGEGNADIIVRWRALAGCGERTDLDDSVRALAERT